MQETIQTEHLAYTYPGVEDTPGVAVFKDLDLTIEKAATIFHFANKFTDKLSPLIRTGLGYLRLGQPTTNLSGGEAARLKLSQALARAKFPNTLFLFDEPARGLHKSDIDKMLALIQELCQNGHTVIAIEHQEDFLQKADYRCILKRVQN